MAQMDFRLLGPLEVWHEGRALDLRGLKRRAVLALLLVHANEVVSRDRLIDELWEEDPPANASAALQNHISRLRKDLGSDVLVTRDAGYLLAVEPDALDVWRFERLVAEAGALAAADRREKLEEALALWRGQALSDLLQEHTLAIESGRLEALRLSALERRIETDLELGRHEQLVPELEALIAAHPLREHPRALLILALYRCGRQAEALEAYRETRRVLVDELGIDPGPELRELEQAILRQDPALAAPEAVPVVVAPAKAATLDSVVEGDAAPRGKRWPLLVAAAVLLGAAGVAAGLLVTGRGSGEPSEQVAGHPVSFIPLLVRLTTAAVTTGQQRQMTVTTAITTSTTTHSRSKQTGQTTQHAVTVVEAQSPPPPPVLSQVGHAANPPPPPPPPPPPTLAYWLTDDFTDPDVDAMWAPSRSGPGIDMAEQANELEVWVPADPSPDPSTGIGEIYGAECGLVGDFDASVDYTLRSWPSGNGLRLGLSVLVSAVGRDFTIERVGGHADGFDGEAYESNVHADTRVRTADRHGGLRLLRRNGVVRAYYRYRGKWILVGAQNVKGQATLRLSFNSDSPPWGGRPALAAFDNFQAIADGVNCPPGTPLPPRKRRT